MGLRIVGLTQQVKFCFHCPFYFTAAILPESKDCVLRTFFLLVNYVTRLGIYNSRYCEGLQVYYLRRKVELFSWLAYSLSSSFSQF